MRRRVTFPAVVGATAITVVIAIVFVVGVKGTLAGFGLTLFYVTFFGWPPAFMALLGLGVVGAERGRQYSLLTVVAGAMAATGVAFPALWLAIFGGALELPMILIGALAGAVGGGFYWWAGGLRPGTGADER